MIKQNFDKALSILKDMKIGLFLNDNQFIEGILLDVKQDHLIVEVDQNIFYFALEHIHALSKNAKDFRVSSNLVPHLDRNSLADLLNELKYSWVTINSLSNQAFFGVLSKISEDHIILINNQEQLYIQKSFITNIYKGIYEIVEQTEGDEPVTSMNDEPKKQTNATQEVKVTVKPIRVINNSESEKHVETPLKEEHAEEENFNNELLEAYTTKEPVEVPDFSQDTAIQESTSHTTSPLTEEFNPPEEDAQDYTKKYIEEQTTEMQDREEIEVEKVDHERLEIYTTKEPVAVPDFSQDTAIQESTSHTTSSLTEEFNPPEGDTQDYTEKHIEEQMTEMHNHEELEVEKYNNELSKVYTTKEPLESPIFSQNTAIQESTSYTTRPLLDPFDFPLEDIWNFMNGKKSGVKHVQRSNKNKSKKHDETPFNNELSKIHTKPGNTKSPIFSKLDRDLESPPENDRHSRLESNDNSLGDEQVTFTEPRYHYKKRKRRRKNSIKKRNLTNHHDEVTDKKNATAETAPPTYDEHLIQMKNDFGHPKSAINLKDLEISNEKPVPAEAKLAPIHIKQMNTQEERTMLEKQYYALMVHAEKMYYQLKDERLDRGNWT